MGGWMSRVLAAMGVGARKTEADVSYDPVLDDSKGGGTPGPGGSDLDKKPGQPPRS